MPALEALTRLETVQVHFQAWGEWSHRLFLEGHVEVDRRDLYKDRNWPEPPSNGLFFSSKMRKRYLWLDATSLPSDRYFVRDLNLGWTSKPSRMAPHVVAGSSASGLDRCGNYSSTSAETVHGSNDWRAGFMAQLVS
jgi:hypothetical protein